MNLVGRQVSILFDRIHSDLLIGSKSAEFFFFFYLEIYERNTFKGKCEIISKLVTANWCIGVSKDQRPEETTVKVTIRGRVRLMGFLGKSGIISMENDQ